MKSDESSTPGLAELEQSLLDQLLEGWDPEDISSRAIATQKERMLIQKATDGLPTWGFHVPTNGDARYVRNAGAVQTKALARYPFVEPTPFKR